MLHCRVNTITAVAGMASRTLDPTSQRAQAVPESGT
jgi:hypothetical protein